MGIKSFFKDLYWKRFNWKYDRLIPYELPVLNADMADKFGVLKEMGPFKRRFPLPCYKWKKAGKSLEKKFGKGRRRDRRPIIRNFFKRWYWKGFNRKYDKHILIYDEIPKINAGIDDGPDTLKELEPFKRHFPFFGYRWQKAGRDIKRKRAEA